MKTHQQIDRRSLALARAIAEKVDRDPQRGLRIARDNCRRWLEQYDSPVNREWWEILQQPWEQIREILLGESDNSRRLRQSSPFAGVLTPRERWAIYRKFQENAD